jgi:hypothetical protein
MLSQVYLTIYSAGSKQPLLRSSHSSRRRSVGARCYAKLRRNTNPLLTVYYYYSTTYHAASTSPSVYYYSIQTGMDPLSHSPTNGLSLFHSLCSHHDMSDSLFTACASSALGQAFHSFKQRTHTRTSLTFQRSLTLSPTLALLIEHTTAANAHRIAHFGAPGRTRSNSSTHLIAPHYARPTTQLESQHERRSK